MITSKLRNTMLFKTDPNLAIERLILGGSNDRRERLTQNLTLRLRYRKSKGTVKEFYANIGNKKIKLGTFPKIKYQDALKLLKKQLIATPPTSAKSPSLEMVYEEFLKHKKYSNATISKQRIAFNKLFDLHKKPIKNIQYEDIINILKKMNEASKYAMCKNSFTTVSMLFRYAYAHRYISKNPFLGVQYTELFYSSCGEHGYIEAENLEGLQYLVEKIQSYQGKMETRNALIFGLLTGLRSDNVRGLHTKHLKQNLEDFYLEFCENETKSNRKEILGIPLCLANWIKSLHSTGYEGLVFPSEAKKYSEKISSETLSKAIRGFEMEKYSVGGRFVFHSLRKVFATFLVAQLGFKNKFAVDLALFHRIDKTISAVSGVYDKSTKTSETREIITFWIEFLIEKGGLKWSK
ncbi:tyrosine-type recombinase/integrase [Campylobacter geochelonis]|uniref:Integrase phage family protein n=1 Tax=Campylobacter geochelonis TaxID=1780362 RepID=A0A128EHC3_9BACT|nr:tyrosine-type recombinase/integrase [Campylobacter geochelonis]QKF71355.1 site-specific tyrosine recombinase, phage integrase family (INT_P4_C domain) [Campylobacter geochelonis]CZE48266.1 integrase phage family protein [Campylobacter geochelonis]